MSFAHKASRKTSWRNRFWYFPPWSKAAQDPDPVETQEWLDALESVLDKEGEDQLTT